MGEIERVANTGLTRRVVRTASTLLNDDAPSSARIVAGAKLATGTAGVAALVMAGTDFVSANPGLAVTVGPIAGHVGLGVTTGVVASGLTYFVAYVAEPRADSTLERIKGRVYLGRVGAVSMVAAGVLGIVGAGIAGTDITGLTHAASLDAGLLQTAAYMATGGLTVLGARRAISQGLPQPNRAPKELSE